jgi:hypothetical protein
MTAKEAVDHILLSIKAFDKNGKRQLKAGQDYQVSDRLWKYGGYYKYEDWYEVTRQLEKLGYKISFYDACNYIEDMYTLIEW